MWERHSLKAWRKTQSTVALSSAESEVFGIMRAFCQALGAQSFLGDIGHEAVVRVQVDAAAAKSTDEGKGLSKVRHLDTVALRKQEEQVCRLLPRQPAFTLPLLSLSCSFPRLALVGNSQNFITGLRYTGKALHDDRH